MTSPAIDGHVTGMFSGHGPGSVALTTTNTNDFIIVQIAHESASATQTRVAYVTSPNLIFRKRGYTYASTNSTVVEEWWALASAALTSETISIEMDGPSDDTAIIAFGVSGATGFDSSGAMPYSAAQNGSWPSVSYTTSNPDDLLIGLVGSSDNNTWGTAPTGWTQDYTVNNAGGSKYAAAGLYSRSVSATEATSFAPGGTVADGAGVIVDALTSDTLTAPGYPLLDGRASNTSASTQTNPQTLSLTTTTAGDTIVVMMATENSAAVNVNSITSTSGLTFTQRAVQTGGQAKIEVWTAPASAALSSEVITVTMNGSFDNGWAMGFGVKSSSGFDANASFPAKAGQAATLSVPSVTYSSNNSSLMLVGFSCIKVSASAISAPVGWTAIDHKYCQLGSAWLDVQCFCKQVSAAVISESSGYQSGSTGDSVIIIDAFYNSSGGGGGGGGVAGGSVINATILC